MDIFKAVRKSKNNIIEGAWLDFIEFNEKEQQTEHALIEQIKHSIYVAQCNYDQWGNDGDYTWQCINGARKFLAKSIERKAV